ncbi:MAG: YceI family protein [Granulosicoccaceae bacterium]
MSINRQARAQRYLVCLVLLLFVSGCASIIRPNYTQELVKLRSGNYKLDKDHAYVNFKIGHLGLSTIVGRFNTVDASLEFDPANIESMKIEGVIEASSIDVNNEDLEDTLRGGYWFDTDRHPQVAFDSTDVVLGSDGDLQVSGELTVLGVTKPITLIGRFNGGADNLLTRKYTLGFTGAATISRAAFGMDAFEGIIADNVDIEIHAEFQRL